MQQPIFIIGTQRSGTTLLTRMLSAHPGLFIQNEMGTYGVFDKPYTTEVLHGRITGRLQDRYSIDVNSLESEGVLWGWKDPMLTPHLDELAEHYPGSKFIVIIRDPRAVVASYIDNAWGLGTTPYTGALRWHDEVTTQLDFCRTHQHRCLWFTYENLIENNQQALTRICEFLGVDFDHGMLEYYKKPLEFGQNRSNMNTQKPIEKSSLSKWKAAFSPRQIGIINNVCQDVMTELDYTDMADLNTRIGGLEKSYYELHQKVMGELQLQYQLRKARRNRKK